MYWCGSWRHPSCLAGSGGGTPSAGRLRLPSAPELLRELRTAPGHRTRPTGTRPGARSASAPGAHRLRLARSALASCASPPRTSSVGSSSTVRPAAPARPRQDATRTVAGTIYPSEQSGLMDARLRVAMAPRSPRSGSECSRSSDLRSDCGWPAPGSDRSTGVRPTQGSSGCTRDSPGELLIFHRSASVRQIGRPEEHVSLAARWRRPGRPDASLRVTRPARYSMCTSSLSWSLCQHWKASEN